MQNKPKAKSGRPTKSESFKMIARQDTFNLGYNAFCSGKKLDCFVYPIGHTLGKAERAGYEAAKVDDKLTNPKLIGVK